MTDKQLTELKQAAREAAKQARAPYSRYPVGAALLTKTGEMFYGCNMESSSYGLSVCAERNAIANALVHGAREFQALAIYSKNAAPPCGACRQVIWDICGDIPVFLFDIQGHQEKRMASKLLPDPFDHHNLEER